MSESLASHPSVALIAADPAGIAALQPTCEILEIFAVGWKQSLLPAADAGTFDAAGLRALVVASSDAALPAALAAASGLPVLRVPTADGEHAGIDLLHDAATSNLPGGDAPFATVAIGEAGAKNAALFVVSMLGLTDPRLWAEWLAFRQRQTDAVLNGPPLVDA